MRHRLSIGSNNSSVPATVSLVPRNSVPPSRKPKCSSARTLQLQVRLQVDQQVAATADIEPRERRVLDDVLRREDDQLAQFFLDAIDGVVPFEEPLQPRAAEFRLRSPSDRCPACASDSERSAVSVAKTLMSNSLPAASAASISSMPSVYASSPLEQAVTQQRISCRPLPASHQRHDNLLSQRLPGVGVAEEPGHVDHQVVGQRTPLPDGVCRKSLA